MEETVETVEEFILTQAWRRGRKGSHLRVSMPSGLRLTLGAALSLQANQSSADSVALHVMRVGGNKSSWNSSLCRGNEIS